MNEVACQVFLGIKLIRIQYCYLLIHKIKVMTLSIKARVLMVRVTFSIDFMAVTPLIFMMGIVENF